jgi:hypothetical protein
MLVQREVSAFSSECVVVSFPSQPAKVVHRKRKHHEISQASIDVMNRSQALPSSTHSLEEGVVKNLNYSTIVRVDSKTENVSAHSVQ